MPQYRVSGKRSIRFADCSASRDADGERTQTGYVWAAGLRHTTRGQWTVHHRRRCNRGPTGRCRSGEQAVHDSAVNVGQPVTTALELIGQLLVVDTQAVQHCGVQIVNVNRLVNDVK